MSLDGHNTDRKSLRIITGRSADWPEVAKDCVAFANAQGGRLLIGIEDGVLDAPAHQEVPESLLDKLRRRVQELTVNVTVALQRQVSGVTRGEYIELIVSRSHAPASTTDGRYYLRVSDVSNPLVGEDVQRLLNERGSALGDLEQLADFPRAEG